jgi:hypothetical protein
MIGSNRLGYESLEHRYEPRDMILASTGWMRLAQICAEPSPSAYVELTQEQTIESVLNDSDQWMRENFPGVAKSDKNENSIRGRTTGVPTVYLGPSGLQLRRAGPHRQISGTELATKTSCPKVWSRFPKP